LLFLRALEAEIRELAMILLSSTASTSNGSTFWAFKSSASMLGYSREEADESAFWMELIIEAELLKAQKVEPLLVEAVELRRIMASSRISASRALKNSKSTNGNRDSKLTSNRAIAIGNRQ